eukprot:4951786-Karenia_brevis.AAC.1
MPHVVMAALKLNTSTRRHRQWHAIWADKLSPYEQLGARSLQPAVSANASEARWHSYTPAAWPQ